MTQYDFSQNRDEIIKRALRLLGVIAQGENPTTVQTNEAATALNGLVKAWQADGMPLWAIKTHKFKPIAGLNTYTFGEGMIPDDWNIPKPLKVLQAWHYNSATNVNTPMRIVTQQEYNMLGNKLMSGTPIQLWYHPLVNIGEMKIYLTPDSYTETFLEIHFVYQAPFADFDAATDVPDFPQEWYDAVTYGLATRLAPEYGIPSADRKVLWQEMTVIKQEALSFGTEEGSLFFQVDRRRWA